MNETSVQHANIFERKQALLTRVAERFLLKFPTRAEHVCEPFIRHGIAVHAHEETVKESFECLILGEMVAGANRHDHGQGPRFATSAEHAFIQDGEQAVQDGAVGVE